MRNIKDEVDVVLWRGLQTKLDAHLYKDPRAGGEVPSPYIRYPLFQFGTIWAPVAAVVSGVLDNVKENIKMGNP